MYSLRVSSEYSLTVHFRVPFKNTKQKFCEHISAVLELNMSVPLKMWTDCVEVDKQTYYKNTNTKLM